MEYGTDNLPVNRDLGDDPPEPSFKPFIFELNYNDIKMWISREEILAALIGAKAWYPMECGVEFSDFKMVQFDPVATGKEIVKDIDMVTVNIFEPEKSRASTLGGYIYDIGDDKLFADRANARQLSDKGIYNKNLLKMIDGSQYFNGMYAKPPNDDPQELSLIHI